MSESIEAFDAQHTYSEAAIAYEDASIRFWKFFSTRTVERLALKPGASVLDVACGTGAGTVAAAQAVGADGRVLAVDFAGGMLDIAREKVWTLGLDNVEFVEADMTALSYDPAAFDAVMCVLAIFFVEDMRAFAAKLWSLVRPGGRLAVTTLGIDVFTPLLDQFIAASQREQPSTEVLLPWRRTEDPKVLRKLLKQAGVEAPHITEEVNELRFEPADWWDIVMGSGLRRTAEALGNGAARVRSSNERWAIEHGIDTLRAGANYALAVKSASHKRPMS